MTDLVACLSTGKGSWIEVAKLINNYDWRNIFLITNDFGKEKFSSQKEVKYIIIDVNKGTESIKKIIQEALKERISGDVAIDVASSTSIEHVSTLSALMTIGVGIRFVMAADSEIKEV